MKWNEGNVTFHTIVKKVIVIFRVSHSHHTWWFLGQVNSVFPGKKTAQNWQQPCPLSNWFMVYLMCENRQCNKALLFIKSRANYNNFSIKMTFCIHIYMYMYIYIYISISTSPPCSWNPWTASAIKSKTNSFQCNVRRTLLPRNTATYHLWKLSQFHWKANKNVYKASGVLKETAAYTLFLW